MKDNTRIRLFRGGTGLLRPTITGLVIGLEKGEKVFSPVSHSKLSFGATVGGIVVGTALGGAVNVIGLPIFASMGVYNFAKKVEK